MGFFDDIFGQPFGGMFDMNGDCKTDLGEEWLGYMVINECMKEDETENSYSGYSSIKGDDTEFWQLDCEDGTMYSLTPYDYSTKQEYEAALRFAKVEAQTKKNNWRNYCEDGLDYDIDPDDYDTEEEYMEALEEAKMETGTVSTQTELNIPIKLTFSIERPGQEELDKIRPEDYPNMRQYKAAYYLCELEQGIGYVSHHSTKENEIEKCKLILSGETVATKYLTVTDGFLYVQAVKEHFNLPIEVDDEDEEVVNDFSEFFLKVAEENPKLAVEIWAWLIKEFGPYKKFMANDWAIYNSIITSVHDYPDEFLPLAIKKIGSDIAFCNELFTENPLYPHGTSDFIVKALKLNCVKEAQIIFTAVAMNTKAKVKDMENLIGFIIMECSNWEEVETMERFKYNLLPIIKKMNSKRIQRLFPDFVKNVDEYIDSVVSSQEKYQYTQKYEWRNKYKDTRLQDIDPLEHETENEYLEAVEKKKYAWRRFQFEAKRYNIDVNQFETESEYKEVLRKKREEEQQSRIEARNKAEDERKQKAQQYLDPLAALTRLCMIFALLYLILQINHTAIL